MPMYRSDILRHLARNLLIIFISSVTGATCGKEKQTLYAELFFVRKPCCSKSIDDCY